MLEKTFTLENLVATKDFAKQIASVIVPDFVITLKGDLGTGKTTLTRYILQKMGVVGSIKSPTFTLVEPYHIKNDRNDTMAYHFDLYRFNDLEEWFYAGFDEYFSNGSICFIEWAEKALALIPGVDWELEFTIMDNNIAEKRILTIRTKTNKGEMCLKRLIQKDVV